MIETRGISVTDLARIRQGGYRLLAAGYGPPSGPATTRIGQGMAALEDLGLGDFAFAQPLRRWVHALTGVDPAVIDSEYVRLFGSGMDGAVCPPMASQYLGENLHGDQARFAGEVERVMMRSGLTSRDTSLPSDHLAVQLELMSALCRAEATTRESRGIPGECLRDQLMMTAGLRAWLDIFSADVADRDRSGAFGLLAAATRDFVDHDHDLVRVIARLGDDQT